jgi:ABC-2 type transport system permease protein
MIRIARKDLKLFISDKKAVMLTFLMPIGLITLFVFAFGGNQQKRDMAAMKLLVADKDKTESSASLIRSLDSLPSLRIEQMDWDSALVKVKNGNRAAALCILPSYRDSMAAGQPGFAFVFDGARATEANIIQGTLTGFLFSREGNGMIRSSVERQLGSEFGMDDSLGKTMVLAMVDQMMSSSGNDDPSASIMQVEEVRSAEGVNPTLIHAVGGTAVMTLLFSVAAMGAGLLEEKEKGTLRKLLLSPISPESILFGKFLAAIVIGFVQLWVMLIFAWLVFDLNILPHIAPLMLLVLMTAFCCGSFGVFLASICTTRRQIEGLSTIIVLVMSAIGGSMIPSFFMPEFMQNFSVISVNYWSIQGFYDILWRESDWVALAFRLIVLLGIGLAMLLLAIPFYRRNILRLN